MQIGYELKHTDALAPVKRHVGDAGWDLFCVDCVQIPPWEYVKVDTGVRVEIPVGYYCQLAPRSGLSVKYGIQLMAGVIDRSYQGTIAVVLFNASNTHLHLRKHSRIVQMLCIKIAEPVTLASVTAVGFHSTRHANGFGEGTGLV